MWDSQLFPAGAFSSAAVYAGDGVIALVAVWAASDCVTEAPTIARSRHEASASKATLRINNPPRRWVVRRPNIADYSHDRQALQVRFNQLWTFKRQGRVRRMPRVIFALVAGLLVLSSPLVSGAGSRPTSRAGVTAAAFATIALGGRTGIEGPWRDYLRLKLGRGGVPVSFTVCAVWGERPVLTQECGSASGKRLPKRATMRLEQHRTAGWKRVGLSAELALEAVLSDAVSGHRAGTVFYRVRLRQPSGRVLRTSNTFRVTWHK
jgi:hypothetical protein